MCAYLKNRRAKQSKFLFPFGEGSMQGTVKQTGRYRRKNGDLRFRLRVSRVGELPNIASASTSPG